MVDRELIADDGVTVLVHVITYGARSLCYHEGLCRGDRNHVHFLTRAPQKDETVAGVRSRREVCVFVDVGAAMDDGINFLIAPSQVIVTTGNAEGMVPVKHIIKTVDKETEILLYQHRSAEVL